MVLKFHNLQEKNMVDKYSPAESSSDHTIETTMPFLLFLFGFIAGSMLPIGFQQLIIAFNKTAVEADGTVVHAKSMMMFIIVGIALGVLGARTAVWLARKVLIWTSSLILGLNFGFAAFISYALMYTGHETYYIVLFSYLGSMFTVLMIMLFAGPAKAQN